MGSLAVLSQIGEVVMLVSKALTKVGYIVGGLYMALQALLRIWDLIVAFFADESPVWVIVNKLRNFIENLLSNGEKPVTTETVNNFQAIQWEFEHVSKLYQCY